MNPPLVAIDTIEKIKEEDFYEPFAEWITNDLEECTKAIALGGSKFKDKWELRMLLNKRTEEKWI
ncbi:MAG: hypothetical protein IPQ06_14180 [Chitinophagaceae bacterium]|nr:hypothetical protein [Chitinophagaceae bacterium]